MDSISLILRSSSARWADATLFTLALGRLRSCQSFTSSPISGIEKPRSRERDFFEQTKLEGLTDAAAARRALQLLAVLLNRFGAETAEIRVVAAVLSNSPYAQSLPTELEYLKARLAQPMQAVVGDLLRERVIHRHLWVALQKFRGGDYTFLMESDDGRLRVRKKDGPVLTNPRLGRALDFLVDIDLLDKNGPTAAGERLLAAA